MLLDLSLEVQEQDFEKENRGEWGQHSRRNSSAQAPSVQWRQDVWGDEMGGHLNLGALGALKCQRF